MLSFFRRQPAIAVAEPPATLATLPVADVPAESTGLLPCERSFGTANLLASFELSWLRRAASALAIPAKHIPRSSLRQSRLGHLGMPLPVFALLNPFYDHGRDRSRDLRTATSMLDNEPLSTMNAYAKREDHLGKGLCFAMTNGPDLGVFTETGYVVTAPVPALVRTAWNKAPGPWFAILAASLPGFIPQASRETIQAAKKAADTCGGDVRLIVEADWKVVAEGRGVDPRSADPIIVLVKDDAVLYVGRFDCTAAEEQLAREHAVKL